MVIKVLGSGCANCKRLEDLAHQAAVKLGIDADIVKIDDYRQIAGYGVMSTPALVVDETVKFAGRVPSLDEIVAILQRAAADGS